MPLSFTPSAPPPHRFDNGSVRAGERAGERTSGETYEVVRRLGMSQRTEILVAVERGPFGFARMVTLERPIPGLSSGDRAYATAALARDARAYARLAHPAVVRLHDFVVDGGKPTLVMEHVEGTSLAQVLARLRARGKRLAEASALYVGYRVFLALSAAHAARDPLTRELAPLTHHAVCPTNVLVPWDGYVKLSGFAQLGAPGYLAPEQVRGVRDHVAIDVYAACLVLRELLLGVPVFPLRQRPEPELLAAMAEPVLIPLTALLPRMPPRITDAIDSGLAPDPGRRITAEGLVTVLRGVLDVEAARQLLVEQLVEVRRAEEISTRNLITTLPDLQDERASAPHIPRAPRSSPSVSVETPNAMTAGPHEVVSISRRRSSVLFPAAIASGIVAAAAMYGGLAIHARRGATAAKTSRPPPALGSITPPPSVSAPLPSPAPAPEAPVRTEPSATKLQWWAGRLVTTPKDTGYRVFVDGVFVGAAGGAPLVVRCGRHDIRVGGNGRVRSVEVPCGGDVEVGR